MTMSALTSPRIEKVNRSKLRQNQKATLQKAKGRTVLLIPARGQEQERLVLDRKYFEEILGGLRAAVETLEITMDQRLFRQVLAAARTLEGDVRRGKLRSIEEVFGEH